MAGLLDLLFNPNAMGGGLLSQFVQQRRQDEPSPLDTAQWPQGPIGAPSGMDAMAQGSLPGFAGASGLDTSGPQQMPAKPSYFESGMKGLRSSDTLLGGLANLITGNDPLAGTSEALSKMGVPPALAPLVAKNPAVIGALLQKQMGLSGQTDDIKEFEYAKQQGFKGTLQDWMQRKRGGAGEYGLQPIWGTDDKGNPTIVQLGKGGDAIQSRLPPGVQVGKDVIKVDAGTETVLLDPVTRQPIGRISKNIAEAKSQAEQGEVRGRILATLPADEVTAKQTTEKIDQLLAHEGLDSIVGPLDQYRPSWALGEKGRDARTRFNQLKGTAFLDAFAMLKGGGAITEVEGQKATEAVARMDRSVSEEDFRQALKDFREAVQVGIHKLRLKAGVASPEATATPAAPGGQSLKDKYGLK